MKIKSFIDEYNWKEINFSSHRKDWKNPESNKRSIALNIFYVSYNTEIVRHAYKSRSNLESQNQVILSMTIDSKKWHYLVVKKLSALLRGETSKHD